MEFRTVGGMKKVVKSALFGPAFEEIWTRAAADIGFSVVRSPAAYASTDGSGRIEIGTDEILDEDDSVAQLVLHELCHALVQGQANWRVPDWGMDNSTNHDDDRERACLRLQAHWAGEYGLRVHMTPTTDWKKFYADLGPDAFHAQSDSDRPSVELAQAALALSQQTAIKNALSEALAKTASLAARTHHENGFVHHASAATCSGCSWFYRGGRGKAVARCRQNARNGAMDLRVSPEAQACEKWEAPVDCLQCGACCREAYHSVSVSMRDPAAWKQPQFIVREGHRWSVLRNGTRCAALRVVPDESTGACSYSCEIYEDRPRTCRDFEQGGNHCLTARKRVGLSP